MYKVIERQGVPKDGSPPVIFDAVYTSPQLSTADKQVKRMLREAMVVLSAGTETTGHALSVITFQLLSNKTILSKLKSELRDAAASSSHTDSKESAESKLMTLKELGKLPYLHACIKEGLRMSGGIVGRLPRINRTSAMSYTTPESHGGKTYTIPPGTPISTSVRYQHQNEDIFEAPHVYKPERWLGGGSNGGGQQEQQEKQQQMDKAFAPFGRGVRGCLGSDLAWKELTLMLGNIMHRFEFELFETTERDVSVQHDFFAPFGPKDSEGTRVVVV